MGEWECVSSDWDIIFSYTEIRVVSFLNTVNSRYLEVGIYLKLLIFQDLHLCFEYLIRKDMTNLVSYHNTRRVDKTFISLSIKVVLPFVFVGEFKILSKVDWLLPLAHTTYTSQFRIPKFAVQISEFRIRNCEVV